MRRRRWSLLVTGFVLGAASAALAHEVRPGYLELRESDPGTYALLWKRPAGGEADIEIAPVIPQDCRLDTAGRQQLTPGAVLVRGRLTGDGGLAGKTLRITRLETTVTDVLVRIQHADGRLESHLLRPATPSVTLGAVTSDLERALSYLQLGVQHILLGVDHLLLPVAWLAGGVAGHLSAVALMPAGVTSLSFLALGIFTAADLKLAPPIVTALAVTMGIVHGWLNGVAIAVAGREASGLVGISGAIFVLVALASAMVVSLRRPWTRIAVRVAGSWIAAIGLLLLGWTLSGRL